MSEAAQRRILIIGSGFGGLGLAIRLKRAGIESFTILEKSPTLGGTWRDNQYPGAACDVPSLLYCLSFDQKTDWSQKWSPAREILDYMEDSARRNGLLSHIRFGMEVTGAAFDEKSGTWRVRTADGSEIVADVLVSGVGQLHRPALPDIPGRTDFRGESFHSARWEPSCELAGKRVGVIGNAASAVQLIPQIAPQAAEVLVFQRSPNWMIPRNNYAYSEGQRWRLRNLPGWARLCRAMMWLSHEFFLLPMIQQKPWASRLYRRLAKQHLKDQVPDPALRAKLTPDYPIGGKRVLVSDDYYLALSRPNVRLVTEGIERITPDGVALRDGSRHEVDVLVFATGFQTNPFLAPMRIEGLGGRSLESEWSQGAHAFFGLTVSGFPNLFLLYGPNTNLGHNSIIFMLECQIQYVMSALQTLVRRDLRYLDVRREAMDAFNAELQSALQHTAWAAAGKSWYKDEAGRITNNWPFSTVYYWWRTRHLNPDDYTAIPRTAVRVPALQPAASGAAA